MLEKTISAQVHKASAYMCSYLDASQKHDVKVQIIILTVVVCVYTKRYIFDMWPEGDIQTIIH